MQLQKLVKPLAGKVVRVPETRRPLEPEGRVVTWSVFWEQQLQDGSIEVSDPPEED